MEEDFEKSIQAHNLKRQLGVINTFIDDEAEFEKAQPVGTINKYGKMKMSDGTWKYAKKGPGSPAATASQETAPAKPSSADLMKPQAGKTYHVGQRGRGESKTFVLEATDGSHLVDMTFDSTGELKAFADKKGFPMKAGVLGDEAGITEEQASAKFGKWIDDNAKKIAKKSPRFIPHMNAALAGSGFKAVGSAREGFSIIHEDSGRRITGHRKASELFSNVIARAKRKVAESESATATTAKPSAATKPITAEKIPHTVPSTAPRAMSKYSTYENDGRFHVRGLTGVGEPGSYSTMAEANAAAQKKNDAMAAAPKPAAPKFNEATKTKATALIGKRPDANGVNRFQGFNIDNENGRVTLYVDTTREARHPEEYGARGREAEKKDQKWSEALYKKVIEPLEKLGYRVSQQAR